MKNIIYIKRLILIAAIAAFGISLTSCEKDDNGGAVVDQGVIFDLVRVETAKIHDEDMSLDQIKTIKVTVRDANDKTIVLPSMVMTGDDQRLTSTAVKLEPGTYTILSYRAFDIASLVLYDEELLENNQFTVTSGNITNHEIEVKFKVTLDPNYIVNGLKLLCTEVFGSDESKWPKEWDFSKKIETWDDVEGWPYIVNKYSDRIFVYFTGFDFHGEEWAVMEKLPETLTYFSAISLISVRDIPNFKEFSSNAHELTWLQSIEIENTAFEKFPDYMFDRSKNSRIREHLGHLRIANCPNFKEIPEEIVNLDNLIIAMFPNNSITTLNAPLYKMKSLDVVELDGNPLTSVTENVFGEESNASVLKFNFLTGSEVSLPSNLAAMPKLKTLMLQGSGLTSVPDVVGNCTKLELLMLDDNKISSVKSSDFVQLTKLTDLFLDGNPLTSIDIQNDNLIGLQLRNTGLSTMPDVSRLPNLRALYLDNNQFETIPTIDFTANEKFRILSLSGNSKLRTIPAGEDFKLTGYTPGSQPVYLRYLFLKDCPQLTWSNPVYWDCTDFEMEEVEISEETLKLDRENFRGTEEEYQYWFTRRTQERLYLTIPNPNVPDVTNIYIDNRGSTGVTINKM